MSFSVANKQTDENGVDSYDATSNHNGHTALQLRVLEPDDPTPGVPHRYLYVIPVEASSAGTTYGNGLDHMRLLNIHNLFNCTLISPSFESEATCCADHPTDESLMFETFLVADLKPWVAANLAGNGEHWLIGFSRSAIGVVPLFLRNPTAFDRCAAWDFPADIAWGDAANWLWENLGTEANYNNNYRLTAAMIEAHKAPFQTARRLWISGDNLAGAVWTSYVDAFYANCLTSTFVIRMYRSLETRNHRWDTGWVWGAIVGLDEQYQIATEIRSDTFTAGADTPINQWPSVGAPDWEYIPGWGSGSDQHVSATNDRVENTTGTANAIVRSIMTGVNIDAEIEADCQWNQQWTLVVPRVSNDGGSLSGYYTTGDGSIYRYWHGATEVIAMLPGAALPGGPSHVRVRAIGTNPVRLEFQFNGGIVYTFNDGQANRAQVGTPGIWSYTLGYVDNVVIRTYDYEPIEFSGTASISGAGLLVAVGLKGILESAALFGTGVPTTVGFKSVLQSVVLSGGGTLEVSGWQFVAKIIRMINDAFMIPHITGDLLMQTMLDAETFGGPQVKTETIVNTTLTQETWRA